MAILLVKGVAPNEEEDGEGKARHCCVTEEKWNTVLRVWVCIICIFSLFPFYPLVLLSSFSCSPLLELVGSTLGCVSIRGGDILNLSKDIYLAIVRVFL